MKSLGLQIENDRARYALVETTAKRFRVLSQDQCELAELPRIAKTAARIILGLNIATLKHQIVATQFHKIAADEYHAYYRLKKLNRWQQLSVKKQWVDTLLLTLKQQGLRVRAVDCQIIAAMRLARHKGLTLTDQQWWRLIEPTTMTLWSSHCFALEHCAVFHYQHDITQITAVANEYENQFSLGDEIVMTHDDPDLNPLLGLALWKLI